MADQLNVTKREARGSLRMKRLRQNHKTPAVLYGHGQENVSLAVETRDLEAAIRHGSQMVDLAGELSESALIKEVQWDELGSHIMHVDLTRVSKGELVEVEVSVELRGEAPGARQGGIVNHLVHEVSMKCPADKIPEKLEVLINELEIGDSIVAGDLKLPEKAELLTPHEEVVVACEEAQVEEPEETTEEGAAEPEVIGRKDDEESEEDSD